MTHQNHQTNGASLEDCHTNFFALTELYGIKWRKLVWGETSGGGGCGAEGDGSAPLADPVISSYARCLAGDILCVWRRVPTPQPQDIYELTVPTATPPPLSLRAAKELWIFWYGEEPDLNGLVAPELIASQGEQGSWESGLSYECRSLLFKALHNLIERCLLSRDFVRLGKWFVQPYDGDEEDVGKSPWHLSFSFAFFLHGESTVCASVDVREHPPVRTLPPRRRRRPHAPDTVILAPFGLSATLTGREWRPTDPATARLLDAWRQLYPLEGNVAALEVVCGGVRMRYPAPYVLSADSAAERSAAPPPALAAHAARALTVPAHSANSQSNDICNGETEKCEDFVDPTRKTPCTCAKSRRRRAARPEPFHRRRPRAPHLPDRAPAGGLACSPGSCGGASPPAPASAPSSAEPHPPHHPPTAAAGGCVSTTLHTPAPTPDPLAPPTPAPPSSKLYNQSESPRAGAAPAGSPGARRPRLPPPPPPPQDPLHDETPLLMLYDYSTVNAWLEHPVKRFKSSPSFEEAMALGAPPDDDLYANRDHIKMAAGPARPHPAQDNADNNDDSKEYKNLFTSDGLCPTLKDLDQIFDNSDDASGDESVRLLQVQTPPDSNKSSDERGCGGGSAALLGGGGLPTELSKMFPTPPSLEAHAQASPSAPGDAAPPAHAHGSPNHRAIEDWSYVFKPPTVCKYVGSSKYAPLTTLPSQLLPPVTLPPHAVYKPRYKEPAGTKRPPSPSTTTTQTPRNPPSVSGPGSVGGGGGGGACGAGTRTPLPPATPPATPPRAATACPLLLNVLLADTVLNVFRDHNFDSCTLCVCNAGPKEVGNIRGADYATYLQLPGSGSGAEDASRCTCGFSAIVNRRLSHRAGLFHEDERDITRVEESCSEAGGESEWCGVSEVSDAVAAACGGVGGGGACALWRAARRAADLAHHAHAHHTVNLLEYSDGDTAASLALGAAGSGPAGAAAAAGAGRVHRWAFLLARGPRSSRDVVRVMRRLRPLLQDAIQKRCCGARMWDGVSGPLTWRQFHRLAGRGNEDLCEPQPVPPLLTGLHGDWVSLSPYALRHWERLQLEPYASPRKVAYVTLAPEATALQPPLRAFLRDLDAAYCAARLGKHKAAAVSPVAPRGLALCRSAPEPSAPDDWTAAANVPGLNAIAAGYVRGYAETLRRLVPALLSAGTAASLIREEEENPPLCSNGFEDEEEAALVLYLVEPCGGAGDGAALVALLRLARLVRRHLAPLGPLVKIISLEGVMESWAAMGGGGGRAPARALAFSVFAGCRRMLHHTSSGKSLTGFGTAAYDNLFLSSKDEKNRAPYALFTPAWVVGGRRAGGDDAWAGGGGAGAEAVLYVAYCLSHDQRWLLAAATDARGELLDACAVNVAVPPARRRRNNARRLGLTKLMDWLLGLMSQSAQPWRLVVGRIGRVGHGELKGWSWLLSRKNLGRASAVLRDLCQGCAVAGGPLPAVQSACLVSTEPDPCLRLMADRFTPDERFSQASIQSHLHTPRDVTATHILVFPTSATTQSNQMPFEAPAAGEDDNMFGIDMADEDMAEENMQELFTGDMFMWAPNSPRASPRRPDDPDLADPAAGTHAPTHLGPQDPQEQVGTVLQQPLALGYLVSTAPLGPMPKWWWAGSDHLRDACPAFLKNALHLQANDDFTSLTQHHHTHPLDSQLTTDVLRYVLEGYNALSWLCLDEGTHDRRSCLPLHVQLLMQLYHTAAALG